MYESILIKSISVVSAKETIIKDILIKKGKIHKLGQNLNCTAEKVIQGSNFMLLPGIIDTHVHFRDPGFNWKEDLQTGSMAAAAGGVTSFFDMPNNNPPTVTHKALMIKKEQATIKSLINYNFFVGASSDNLEQLNDFGNIPGIKVFMGSSTGSLLLSSPDQLEYLFATTKHLLAIHAEDEEIINNNKKINYKNCDIFSHELIRSPQAALKSVKIAVELSLKYGTRTHLLHITSKPEVDFLASLQGKKCLSTEVTPQHLLLNSPDIYKLFGEFAQVNPPIRKETDRNALFQALKTGVINCLATDHAPHSYQEKSQKYPDSPSGMPGVETALPLMLDLVNQNKFSINDVVKWMCEEPARIFKIKNKGKIKEGYDADLVLVDLKKTKKIINEQLITKCKWSVFNGQEVKGWPVITIVAGNIVYREGDFFTKITGKEIEIG